MGASAVGGEGPRGQCSHAWTHLGPRVVAAGQSVEGSQVLGVGVEPPLSLERHAFHAQLLAQTPPLRALSSEGAAASQVLPPSATRLVPVACRHSVSCLLARWPPNVPLVPSRAPQARPCGGTSLAVQAGLLLIWALHTPARALPAHLPKPGRCQTLQTQQEARETGASRWGRNTGTGLLAWPHPQPCPRLGGRPRGALPFTPEFVQQPPASPQ